jgi:hypothetical protein
VKFEKRSTRPSSAQPPSGPNLSIGNPILIHIHKQNGQRRPLKLKELLQFIREHYAPQLIKWWMHAFLGRYRDAFHIYRPCHKKTPNSLFRVNILKDRSKL